MTSMHDYNSKKLSSPLVTASLETITPATADLWLRERNNLNPRPLSKVHVARLARDFSENGYSITGESIILTAAGEVLDGQHRLAAIVKSGITAQVMVVRGIAHGAREVIDSRQRMRGMADLLGGMGVKNAHDVSALGGLVFRYISFGERSAVALTTGAKTFSAQEKRLLQTWTYHHSEFLREMNYAAKRCIAKETLGGANMIAFAPAVSALSNVAAGPSAYEESVGASREYLNGLSSMADLKPGDSRLALIRYRGASASSQRKQANGHWSYRSDLLALCASAWNAWIEGRQVDRLQRPKTTELSIVTYPPT